MTSFAFPQPLTEKYRPKKIADFIGLAKPKKIIEAFIERPFEAAFLFLGPSGIGKTVMALAMAEQLNAELHHAPSRQCDLEMVANITHQCHFAAFNFQTGKARSWHLVLIDEADQVTAAAQNCLLSKLDSTDAPPKTVFVFTANSTAALEDRFLSRCRVLKFEHESLEGELESYLTKIYRKEGGKHPLSFKDICKASSYNVRDALMKLEIEVLMGPDRSDLPAEKELEIVEEHPHSCPKCSKSWKHAEPLCKLPYRSECQPCGGVMTNGQLAAKKAWVTIRANIAEQIKNGGKKKRKKRG